jgi:hypothetical protein
VLNVVSCAQDKLKEIEMNTSVSRIIVTGLPLLFTLVSGVWLSNSGKPYNSVIFTIHKLIALGTVVFAAIQTYNVLKGADVQLVVIALAALCVLCVVTLFATGAFMSIGNLPNAPLLTIHRIALIILPLAAAGTIYFLIGKPQ